MSDVEVNCPTCGKVVIWNADATYRPFCSKRCHMIDLGDWFTEGHRIPGKPTAEELLRDEFDLPADDGFFQDDDSKR